MVLEQGKFAVKTSGFTQSIAVIDNSEVSEGERSTVTTSGAARASNSELPPGHVLTPEQLAALAARPQKDNWDKLAALAPIISAALIFLTGSYCTYTYNQQQIRIQQCQTIEKFIPHLMGNEQTKKAAILALSTLINTETAGKFASIFASTGTVSALQSLSQNGSEKDKLIATQALSTALQNLTDRESKISTIEQDYKKALQDKAESSKDNRDTPYNLNKLAQLYIIRGQYADAEPLLKQSLEIREHTYGPEHPQVVDALKGLADLYRLSGKTALAEATLKRARDLEEKPGFNPPNKAIGLESESQTKTPASESNVIRSENDKTISASQGSELHPAELPSGEQQVDGKLQ